MHTIFTNSESSKANDPHRLLLKFLNNTNLKRRDKYVALSDLRIYYTWRNIRKSYKSNKFKISIPTWNKEVGLPDRSNSVSDIQDYFKYILKEHEAVTDNPSIMIYRKTLLISLPYISLLNMQPINM